MSDEYEIARYTGHERDAILAVQRHHWGEDADRNRRYLGWKYEGNPYIREPLIYVARCKGTVVGWRGMYGSRWEVGSGDAVTLPCAADVVIEPEHRRRGLFARMTRAAEEDLAALGYRFALNLSASPITHASCLALGWRGIGALRKVASEHPTRLWTRLRSVGAGIRVAQRLQVASAPRPREMAGLVARLGGDGRLRHVRDAAYFAWRYQNPFCHYEFLFWGEDPLEGYLVLQQPAQAPAITAIADCEAATDAAREGLLACALRRLDDARPRGSRQLIAWGAALPGDAEALLMGSGFAPVAEPGPVGRARPTVLVKALGPDAAGWELGGKPLLDLRSWDLRMSYSDAF